MTLASTQADSPGPAILSAAPITDDGPVASTIGPSFTRAQPVTVIVAEALAVMPFR
jgi:hypothetical protein